VHDLAYYDQVQRRSGSTHAKDLPKFGPFPSRKRTLESRNVP